MNLAGGRTHWVGRWSHTVGTTHTRIKRNCSEGKQQLLQKAALGSSAAQGLTILPQPTVYVYQGITFIFLFAAVTEYPRLNNLWKTEMSLLSFWRVVVTSGDSVSAVTC